MNPFAMAFWQWYFTAAIAFACVWLVFFIIAILQWVYIYIKTRKGRYNPSLLAKIVAKSTSFFIFVLMCVMMLNIAVFCILILISW